MIYEVFSDLIYKNSLLKFFDLFKRKVSLFPLIYLVSIYLSRFITLSIWNEKTFFELWTMQEYLSEHFQFIFYLCASLISVFNIFKNQYKFFSLQNFCWLIFLLVTSFICIEEISFLNLMNVGIFQALREFNVQNEINFHNNKFIQPYLHDGFILFNLFLGWFGWRYLKRIEAIPAKAYSLYFLFTCLAYSFIELQPIIRTYFPTLPKVFIHQENFEFLMAMGLFLHAFDKFQYYFKINN